MPKHEHFEELCVAAAAGELSAVERGELEVHLEECLECRRILGDSREIHAQWFPERPGFEIRQSQRAEARLREVILLRAAEEVGEEDKSLEVMVGRTRPSRRGPEVRVSWAALAPKLSLVGGALMAVVGIALTTQVARHRPSFAQGATPEGRVLSVTSPGVPGSSEEASREQRKQREAIELALKKSQAETARFAARLKEAEDGERDSERLNAASAAEAARLKEELASARAEGDKTREELAKVVADRQIEESAIALQNREIVNLNARLDEKSSEKDQGQGILDAERKLRELVGARNLHIVDVYDTESDGRTAKSVGRVFFTEGKSLVFYAYDLATNKAEGGKYAYYVWGLKQGDMQTAQNLGTLDPDDALQKRWMLKVNDAQALEKIERVFVTLEPLNKLGPRPRGRRILSAFLGTPANHP